MTAGSEEFVAVLDRWRAPHVASLLEAASWAKADLRLEQGLRTHLPAFDVRRKTSGEARRDRDATALSADHVAPADLARYEAAPAADVSSSLEGMTSALRQVVASMDGGTPIEGAWLAFEIAVLGLCVEPTSSLADRLDMRRVLLIG